MRKRVVLKTGDLVRAFNNRGQVLVGAEVTDRIKQGSVCVHEGGWPDLDPKAAFVRTAVVTC